jgi:hypothetical protein
MVIELDKLIDILLSDLKKPEIQSIIAIITIGVTLLIPSLNYYFKNKKIPKLVFDGVWKQNAYYGVDYFLKVKRDKGEGEGEGVKGFVGIKDKLELNPSGWIKRNTETDIVTYDYLSLFKTFEHKGHEIITFHTKEYLPPPDDNNLYEKYRYPQFKDDKLIVEINAKRGRIKDKQFIKKIDDIVKEAKQILCDDS